MDVHFLRALAGNNSSLAIERALRKAVGLLLIDATQEEVGSLIAKVAIDKLVQAIEEVSRQDEL